MKTEIRIIAEMTDEQCEVLTSELINTSEIIGIKLEVESSKLSQHDVIKNEVAVCGKCIGRGSIVIYDTCLDCDKCGGTGTQTVL